MKRAIWISLGLWSTLLALLLLLRSGGEPPEFPRQHPARAAFAGSGPTAAPTSHAAARPRPSPDAASVPGRRAAGARTPAEAADAARLEEPPEEEGLASDEELLECIGLGPDTPLALCIGRFGPPDPVEPGRAELHLTLRDQETGEPVEGDVVLWRLNAPPNAYWTAGDQDVARMRVSNAGATFTGLTSGEYRPVVLDERAAAPHHPALHVSGKTAHGLYVQRPRDRPVFLVLEDTPAPTPVVEARFLGARDHARVHVPPWVRPREIQPSFDWVTMFEAYEDDFWGTGPPPWVTLAPTALGYDAGTLREDRRDATVTHAVELRVDGRRWKSIEMRNPPTGHDPYLRFPVEPE